MRAWWIILALKLALAAWLPFSSDEAYYWVWGHFPALGYFDHPPMVGWLFWLGRGVDGLGQSSRWPGVLLGHAMFLPWRELLKQYLSDRDQTLWLAFLSLSVFPGFASLVITPDVPLLFFWSLSILCAVRAAETRKPIWYVLLGASLGLGFCSKYVIALFVPACAGWIAFTPEARRNARWGWAAVTVAVGFAFCLPVFLWNAEHDWASFRFQLEHGLDGGAFRISWPIEYASAQLGLLLPPLAYLATRGREPQSARWLRWFAFFPLAFFLASSFRARVEANWPIVAYPAALTLAFLNARSRFWIRAAMSLWAVALFGIALQVAHPWLPIDPQKLKTNEMRKYDALLPLIEGKKNVFATTYQMAATLSYRTKRMIPKLAGNGRPDFYDFQFMSRPNEDTFLLAAEMGQRLPPNYESIATHEAGPDLLIHEVVRRAKDRDP